MRTHSTIIRDAGGPVAVLEVLRLAVSIFTVRSWVHRDSIPGEHWKAFSDAGIASLEELAAAAALKREAA